MKLFAKTIAAQAIRNIDVDVPQNRVYDMIEWCFEAEKLIGTLESYEHKECILKITNYRAELPNDFCILKGIKIGENYPEATNRDFTLFNKNHASLANRTSGESISNISHDPIYNETKFWIGDGYIHTTVESVDLGISYWGFPLDDEGYPLVHKNHAEAVTAYLMYMYYQADFIKGKISLGAFNHLQNRWWQLCNDARANDNMPNRKEIEAAAGIWNNFNLSIP